MNGEIIAVGSELLLGQIVNSNASFLSGQLAEIGVNVYFHTVVGDNSGRLKSVLEMAEARSDLIIITGGLGPTKDDLTKETVAGHLKKPLVTETQALRAIESYFERTGRKMTDNNRKQALVIDGSHVLANEHGMAPGMLVDSGKKTYMLLPGPPSEMEPMFLKYGYPALLSKMEKRERIVSRVLRFFGIGEALLETEIEDILENQGNPTVAPLASDGEVSLRLTAKHLSVETAQHAMDEVEKEIMDRVGTYFYGYDDTSLMEEVSKLLREKGMTIASAESLTGGMFQQELTAIPGAGTLLKGGVVCYTNEAKANVVKVRKETLEKEGAVSAACATELAENIRSMFHSDIGISFTGVAGPEEMEGQPVGTVYIGIAIKGKPTRVEKLHLGTGRKSNRIRTVKYGCHYLLETLKQA